MERIEDLDARDLVEMALNLEILGGDLRLEIHDRLMFESLETLEEGLRKIGKPTEAV